MSTPTLAPPPEIVKQRDALSLEAEALKVVTKEDYARAGAFLVDLKSMLSTINDTFDPVIRAANEAHKAALAAKKEHAAPLLHAEVLIKGRMGKYAAEERERARQEQERLEREARERAEREAEARRKAEEAKRLEEAELLEFAGQTQEAMQVIDAPMPPPPPPAPVPIVKAQVPKTDGIQVRERWKAKITDPAALLRAIFDRRAPAGFVDWNHSSLQEWATRTKGTEQFPGLIAELVTDIAAGRR